MASDIALSSPQRRGQSRRRPAAQVNRLQRQAEESPVVVEEGGVRGADHAVRRGEPADGVQLPGRVRRGASATAGQGRRGRVGQGVVSSAATNRNIVSLSKPYWRCTLPTTRMSLFDMVSGATAVLYGARLASPSPSPQASRCTCSDRRRTACARGCLRAPFPLTPRLFSIVR